MKAARLEIRAIHASYGSLPILHDVSLAVEPGSLVALLGPSGCGKTTLLRVIGGMLSPSSGEVLFDSAPVTRLPPERREIAMVFQKPLLFPHLSVAGNVGFGLHMRGVAKRDAAKRVSESLDLVRLSGLEERRATELSGGQEQRVALARALVTEPRILLLDEPFAALDEKLRAEMRALVKDLQQRLHITAVFVTHDQKEAARIADRVALMLDGRIEQEGTARELFRAPKSPASARFFGWRLWKVDADREAYFRPEDARLARNGEHCGIVTGIIDVGTHVLIQVALDGGLAVELRQDTTSAAVGDRVTIHIPKEAIRAF